LRPVFIFMNQFHCILSVFPINLTFLKFLILYFLSWKNYCKFVFKSWKILWSMTSTKIFGYSKLMILNVDVIIKFKRRYQFEWKNWCDGCGQEFTIKLLFTSSESKLWTVKYIKLKIIEITWYLFINYLYFNGEHRTDSYF
jgi:hypothetical protein